jgi:hypothetical protein
MDLRGAQHREVLQASLEPLAVPEHQVLLSTRSSTIQPLGSRSMATWSSSTRWAQSPSGMLGFWPNAPLKRSPVACEP